MNSHEVALGIAFVMMALAVVGVLVYMVVDSILYGDWFDLGLAVGLLTFMGLVVYGVAGL